MTDLLSLLDYRRRVEALYAEVRTLRDRDPEGAHGHWRAVRDQLFRAHPQSALDEPQRGAFAGLRYYDYDPAWAVVGRVDVDVEHERYEIGTSGGGEMAFVRFAVVHLPFGTLDAFWLDAYGGGLFLPFRDATAGDSTYGGGRYLYDTVKGADLGSPGPAELVCDFNFAYNPSCHYSPSWSCPLAPPDNRLEIPIEAGEQTFPAS